MPQNADTQTSPGIGLLPADVGFADQGGCIIDLVGLNDMRLSAQIATSRMFYGWTGPLGPRQSVPYPPNAWLRVCTEAFDATNLAVILGGGIAKANIRITLFDGDSGSPNPVYLAMFGSGAFPYSRWSPQPGNYDFDGGQNLWLGFEDAADNPVRCGYMGEATSYRLANDGSTVESFTGFPGVFALNDLVSYPFQTRPPQYQPAFAVTGWFSVPVDQLATFYARLLTGSIVIGVHDITPGDQFYDFMQGLASDVQNIPLVPIPPEPLPTPPPSIDCGSPPSGVVGQVYDHALPYQVSTDFFTIVVDGGLPGGLAMSPLGRITGVPLMPGTFSFTTTITDSQGQTDSVTCSITITSPSATGQPNVAF